MKLRYRLAAIVGVIAIGSALAVANVPAKPGHGNGNGPPVTGPSGAHGKKGKARAYGKRCKGVSKKHIAGEKGTPHSQCVHALRRLAKGKVATAEQACAPLSQASDRQKCIAAGNKLLAGQRP